MKLLTISVPGQSLDKITLDSPDGHYVDVVSEASENLYKRGRYLYRDHSAGSEDFAWDLDYPNPAFRDYNYSVIYKGPEVGL